MKPLVSILIPCYNHEQFLPDCLDSVLAQDYENIELLICDDCSPDGSKDVIASYGSKLRDRFARVELLYNDVNYGVTKNVNRMLALAKGEFVKTIASDDAMAPDAIRSMAEYLLQNPETDVVVANGFKVPEDQHYPDFQSSEKIYPAAPDFSPEGFFERVARCNPISAPAAMVRMSIYREYGFYDETVKVEDYEFWLRVLSEGNARFGFLDKNLLFYRINANSMTSLVANAGLARRRKLIHQSEMATLRKFRKHLNKHAYASIVMDRIAAELWMAVKYQHSDWEKELRQEWKDFNEKKDLFPKQRLSFFVFGIRQYIKKTIRLK